MPGNLLRIILYTAVTGFVLFIVVCKPIKYQPYHQTRYYRKTLSHIDSLSHLAQRPDSRQDTLQAGWSRRNITPNTPLRLMGYGLKGNYTQVHDSLYVSVVVLSDGHQKAALVSYDLMIVSPAVAQAVRLMLDSASLGIDHTYFTAIHTHNGYGEWAQGLAGQVVAGKYNPALVRHIAVQTRQAVQEAAAALSPAALGYAQYPLPALVVNRLVQDGATDDWLRVVKLQKKTGETGLICTFAAHATYFPSRSKDLSADYPGALVRQVEADTAIDFALFAAGAVGSHSPVKSSSFSYKKLERYAAQIAAPLHKQVNNIPTKYQHKLRFLSLPVSLPKPQLKISEQWRLRPGVFNMLFGKMEVEITLMQAGNIVFLGYPADFSGLLYDDLVFPPGLHGIVSSFNGGYIGYIVPDIYYHKKHRETQELNWFGPTTGSYFVDISNRLLQLTEENSKNEEQWRTRK